MPNTATNLTPIRVAITYVLADSLILDKENPRQHSQRQITQLADGIREFGFLVPIVIDHELRVIAGHARVLAARKLGMTELPAIEVRHLSSAQLKAFRLADNKLALNASWDERLLAKELMQLTEINLDFSISLTGFSTAEVDIVIGKQKGRGRLIEDPASWTGPVVSQVGDLWMLGHHCLFCEDSTSFENFARLMGDAKADMVFADPPYNVRIEGNVSGKGRRKHRDFVQAAGEMSGDQFKSFLQTVCLNLAAHSRDGALVYLCMDWRHTDELLAAGREAFSELKNIAVWVKDNPGLGSLYRSAHEFVFIFKSGVGAHINNIELGKYGRNRSNVWCYDSATTAARRGQKVFDLHPTVKPLPMVVDAIMDASHRGGIILDCFLGSGTTLIAAEQAGRQCRGFELDPVYADTIIRRWQIMTGQDAVRNDGAIFAELERNNGEGR
ncbi:DNA methyltransferase [uncultured Bradyrhizobium sp.]|jgi:DNA modification methylase|uniref:site-specific DNA-methyltransferase n=1 Tax=uncultured Bradyrhizobium sp. TaxID=199684 RepID=UPI00260D781F|nr:DNA methyltransferase [uncultured Bradyrhizobium sp.]